MGLGCSQGAGSALAGSVMSLSAILVLHPGHCALASTSKVHIAGPATRQLWTSTNPAPHGPFQKAALGSTRCLQPPVVPPTHVLPPCQGTRQEEAGGSRDVTGAWLVAPVPAAQCLCQQPASPGARPAPSAHSTASWQLLRGALGWAGGGGKLRH